MTVVSIEATIERLESVAARLPRPERRRRSIVILGKPTETNRALAAAFSNVGERAQLADPAAPPRLRRGDIAVTRIDVLPTLDGIEPGLWGLARLAGRAVYVMNGPLALFAAHDKLSTALFLGRAGVEQPRTAHLREASNPPFPPPYVVKPRFGSWGRDVYLCRDEAELSSNSSGIGIGSAARACSCSHSSSPRAATCGSSSPGAASSALSSAVPSPANGGRTCL
jgi:hypothetical protein